MTKKQQTMIIYLEDYYHNVTKACKEVGISTPTHYEWIAKSSDYKKACLEVKNGLVERAEQILHSKFETDTTALIFFLKCKGGYSEKLNELEDPKPIRVQIERISKS